MNGDVNNNLNDYEQKFNKRMMTRELMLKGSGMGAVVIAFIALQFVFMFLIGLIARLFMESTQYVQFLNGIGSNPLILIILPILSIFLPFYVYALITRTKIKKSYKKPHLPLDFTISLYFMGMAATIFANNIAAYIQAAFNFVGVDAQAHQYSPPESVGGMIFFLIGISVVPAVVEEFACRSVALNSLRQYGDAFAIVCSSVVFGLMHSNLIQIPFGFLGGLIFAYLAVRTGNVWLPMAIHFTNNLVSGVMFILLERVDENILLSVQTLYGNIFVIGGLIALIYAVGIRRYPMKLAPSPKLPISRGRAYASYLLSPAMVLSFLALAALAVLEVIAL